MDGKREKKREEGRKGKERSQGDAELSTHRSFKVGAYVRDYTRERLAGQEASSGNAASTDTFSCFYFENVSYNYV